MTFARLVLRVPEIQEIRVSGDELRVKLLDEMRRFGYPAVGAESLVFDRDRSEKARFQLGGTIKELRCAYERAGVERCWIGIEWELLDRRVEGVVYRVLTRATASGGQPEVVGEQLVMAAFHSLLARQAFVDAQRKDKPEAVTARPPQVRLKRCPRAPSAMPEGAERVMQGAVVVESGDSGGSGSIISPDGYVLTAAHLVLGGQPVLLQKRNGQEFAARVLRVDRRHDVALLLAEKPLGKDCVALRDAPPRVGEELYAIGSPASRELAFSITRGIVSGTRTIDGVPLVQTDASINPGNSGGPLVDREGRVVAVVSYKLAGKAIEGIGFGVPSSTALKALGLVMAEATDEHASRPLASEITSAPAVLEDVPDPIPSSAPYGDSGLKRRSKAAKALKTAGLVTLIAGGAVVVLTYTTYSVTKDEMTQGDFETLRKWNDIGWVVAAAGGAALIVSFTLSKESVRADQSARGGGRRWNVGFQYPGVLGISGSY